MVTGAQSRRAQALWAALDGQAVIQPADSMTLTTRDLDLAVSPPLPHGLEGTSMGYVVALTVTDHHEHQRFVFASDVQGPLSPVASAWLIQARPTTLVPLGTAVLHRAGAGRRGHRALGGSSLPDHRRHRLPRHHGPSRRPRSPLHRALRAAVGDRPGRDRRRAPGTGGPAAGSAAGAAVGRRPQAAGQGRASESCTLACYHDAQHPQLRERGEVRVSTPTDVTLNVGDPAPDFTLRTIGLKEISLSDYRGKRVVILFYPLDWTPG